jgi:hypothetical protein
MFVTQKEIEARLASDANLLNSLLIGRPSDQEGFPSEIHRDEVIDTESLKEPDDETTSANTSSDFDSVECLLDGVNINNGSNNSDPDVKLQRILDDAQSETQYNKDRRSGRPNGAADRTTEQRADIALMGTVLGNSLASDLLGVSTASPSLHRRGLVNHEDDLDFDLSKVVKRKLHKIRNKSADALIKVLDMADTNQMYDAIKTAKDAVFVANQLANVVQKVQPQEQEQKPTAQFVIIQPTVRTVEQYEVINV